MQRRFTILIILLFISGLAVAQEQGVSSDVISAYPAPGVTPLPIDESVLYRSDYRKSESALNIYSGPNGQLVETLNEGFNYLSLYNHQGDWAQIGDGKWVRISELSEDVLISRYAGVQLPDTPLPYPMAWTLRHLRASNAPGEDQNPNNPFLYRYSRVNIYATVELNGYNWYQIGEDQWVHQFNVAKVEPIERPLEVDTDKWIAVDLYEQTLIAYDGTTPQFATLISSGLSEWATNEGLFHVYLRYPTTTMSGAYNQPDFYVIQDVPYTMYFDNDIALHGTFWHDGFGYRQSHGCVNMSIMDSKWIYEWAESEFDYSVVGDEGPAVYVYSSGSYD